MIELGVVKSSEDKEILISAIKEKKNPFKLIMQDIYPERSLDQNAYYWLVITIIAEKLGENYIQVHEDYKRMFLYGLWPTNENGKTVYKMRVRSTTELNSSEMAYYTERVRIHAVNELHINTPNPNEIITEENENY